jgi:O-antigen/teichoic acid export membrane protein
VTALVQLVWLRPRPRALSIAWRAAAADHWQYGKWALASAVAIWFPLNVYYYVLPASSGLEAAGALRALLNLANPGLHSLTALTLMLTPALVRARETGGDESVDRTGWRTAAICLAGATAVLLLLCVFRADVLRILYGTKYAEYSAWPVILAGLLPLAASITTTVGSALRAIERPRQVFLSYAIFAIAAALIGVPLSSRWGLTGALAGMLLSYVALALAMVIFFRAARRPPQR